MGPIRKKFSALAAVLAIIMTLGLAGPSQAATSGLVCNQSNVTGAITVVKTPDGFWGVTGYVSDNAGRQWGWELYENGNRFTNGSHAGSFNTWRYDRLNKPGNDTYRFHVWNAAGTINCNASATVG